jgi:hypothetical protein
VAALVVTVGRLLDTEIATAIYPWTMEIRTSVLNHLSALVQGALDDADDPSVSLAIVARKALRIARMRGDWEVAWWLQLEMQTIKPPKDGAAYGLNTDGSGQRASAEAKENLSAAAFDAIGQAVGQRWIGGRKVSSEALQHLGIPDAEIHAATLREQIDRLAETSFGNSREMFIPAAQLRAGLKETESLLARLRNEVCVYLSDVECRLVLGEVSEDVWARNRAYVDSHLARIAPQAVEQFAAAYRRRAEGDAEARSHSLTSCRRVLKTVADVLYPASNVVVSGIDERPRKMTDDKFISRLCQFASEGDGSTSAALVSAQVGSLADRLAALNSLSSKGVHDEASSAEVDQCIIQTYLVVGDLLRIAEAKQLAEVLPLPA